MSKKSKKKELEKELEREKKKNKKQKKASKQAHKENRDTPTAGINEVTPDQRLEMIATAAYYIAERHGFTPGESDTDWRTAEREIDALLEGQQGKKRKGSKRKD